MDDLFWKRGVANIPDKELWDVHNLQKENLIRFVRSRERAHLARHGASPDDLRSVDELLDPQALTIGFARRFATYKRADLLFRDLDRLRAILKNPERPVQIHLRRQGASGRQTRPGTHPPHLRHLAPQRLAGPHSLRRELQHARGPDAGARR